LLGNQVLVALESGVPLVVTGDHDPLSVVVLPCVTVDLVTVPDVQGVMRPHLSSMGVCNLDHVVGTLGAVTLGCVDSGYHGSVRSSKSVYSTSLSVCSCVHAVAEICVFVHGSDGCVVAVGISHVYFSVSGSQCAVFDVLCVVFLDLSKFQHSLSVKFVEVGGNAGSSDGSTTGKRSLVDVVSTVYTHNLSTINLNLCQFSRNMDPVCTSRVGSTHSFTVEDIVVTVDTDNEVRSR